MLDCGAPPNASGVVIDPFNDTEFGALITFHCETSMTAVCGSDGEWSTSPASLKCGDTCSAHSKFTDDIISYSSQCSVASLPKLFPIKPLL